MGVQFLDHDLPTCLPALAFALLDFSTALRGRNHRQGLRMKTEEDFLTWHSRQALSALSDVTASL